MSEFKTTVTVDGETVERNSIRAYEISRGLANDAYEALSQIRQLGVGQDLHTEGKIKKAERGVLNLATRLGGIAEEYRRRERLATSVDDELEPGLLLKTAIEEQNYREGRR